MEVQTNPKLLIVYRHSLIGKTLVVYVVYDQSFQVTQEPLLF